MVLLANGLRVWIEMAGEATVEYMSERGNKEGIAKTNCFIEVVAGKTFKVCYKGLVGKAGYQCDIDVFIDGEYVTGALHCVPRKHLNERFKREFEGYWEVNEHSEDVLRAFVFGKVEITKDGKMQDLPKHLKEEGCSIRVVFETYRINRYRHVELKREKNREKTTYKASVVHEDTKPAYVGLLIEPGEILSTSRSTGGSTCRCISSHLSHSDEIVVFKYRSSELLIRHDIKKDPNAKEEAKGEEQEEDDDKVIEVDKNSLLVRSENTVDSDPIESSNIGVTDHSDNRGVELPPSSAPILCKRGAGSEPLEGASSSKIKLPEVYVRNENTPSVKEQKIVVLAPRRFIEVDIVEKQGGEEQPSPI